MARRITEQSEYGPHVDRLKLEAVSTVLAGNLYPSMGYVPEHGVDVLLCRRARAQGRVIRGLELRTEQERAFLTSTTTELTTGLEMQFNHPELMHQLAEKVVSSFRDGDVQSIDEIRATMRRYAPIRTAALLEGRESKWSDLLKVVFAQNRSVFIVVGALHVAATGGILERLTRARYNFDRIT